MHLPMVISQLFNILLNMVQISMLLPMMEIHHYMKHPKEVKLMLLNIYFQKVPINPSKTNKVKQHMMLHVKMKYKIFSNKNNYYMIR